MKKMMTKVILAFTLVILTVAMESEPVKAQRRPDIGQITRETETARPSPSPPSQDSGLGTSPLATRPTQGGGPTMMVRGFQVEGADVIREKEFAAVLEPYQGRELTMAQIQEAAEQAVLLCRSRGYILANAFLPVQDAGMAGIVVIRIVLGQYGEVTLENKSLLRDSSVKGFLDAGLPRDGLIRQDSLERTVFLIGDLPGATTPQLNLSPGAAPGTTNILVEAEPGKRLGGYFLTDNLGSRYTGRYRFNAGLDVNSPFGIGDKFSVFGMTTQKGDLSNAGFDFSLPLGHSGLRLNLGYSRVYYKLGEEFEFLDAKGSSDTFTGALSYPLFRSTERNVWLTLRATHKNLRDEIGIADYVEKKKIFTVFFEARHEAWWQFGGHTLFTEVAGSFTSGRLSFNDPTQARDNQLGVDTVGSFAYVNLRLIGRLNLSANWTLEGSGSLQKSLGRNLDSAEQFLVTGSSGVKAYREILSGDNGWLLSAQVRYRLPELTERLEHSLGFFIDYGGWRHEDADWLGSGAKRSDSMTGVGISYNLYYKPLVLSVQAARAVGAWPDGLEREGRVHVLANVGVFF
jgi:hemolysin activation/secretion protein